MMLHYCKNPKLQSSGSKYQKSTFDFQMSMNKHKMSENTVVYFNIEFLEAYLSTVVQHIYEPVVDRVFLL